MIKILVTGENSYIGTSFAEYMSRFSNDYHIDTISVIEDDWKKIDFSGFDSLIHVAAIVHVKENDVHKYDSVNCDLAYAVAEKAKNEGVSQFIFLSSMSVYGLDSGVISSDTVPRPNSPYGQSKLNAETLISKLGSEQFSVCILRPPMIYGKDSVGNYSRLAKLAVKSPVFPRLNNERSMLYIGNLTRFLKLSIDKGLSGTFFPQNSQYVNTSRMVLEISKCKGKPIKLVRGFNGIIVLLSSRVVTLRKVFGSLTYSQELLGSPNTFYKGEPLDYEMGSFQETIRETEG